jgi:hypothetical protein
MESGEREQLASPQNEPTASEGLGKFQRSKPTILGHWLQNLISISLCIEIASNDDEPRFPVREKPLHTITLPPPRCYSIGAAISIAFSASSPHFDSTIQLP